MEIGILFLALIGGAFGGSLNGYHGHHGHGAPAQALVQSGPAHISEAAAHSAPQQYGHEIPAAAIRNVETIDVTKTITPVVTKTTTHKTHSEPALSVGHVQGYSQSSHGPGKVAPVEYNTQYTQYLNPTVGVNGPVTYSGPAVGQGVAVQQGVGIAQVVAEPQPVAFGGHGIHQQGFAGYQQQPFGYQGGPAAYANFGGKILNSSPFFGLNNLQPQFLNAQPQLLNAGHQHQHHGHAGYQPEYNHGIGITAYDSNTILSSAGYDGGLHSVHGF